MQNLTCENEFDLHGNELVGGSSFRMNGFARSLVLTQKQLAYCNQTALARKIVRYAYEIQVENTMLNVISIYLDCLK